MKNILKLAVLLLTTSLFAQAGHIMQGVGSVNMSMGGAATAQPLDISGALQWNPAAISVFDSKIINFDIGAFFSSPELSSTVPEFNPNTGQPTGNFYSGTTKDDRGVSPMPALAYVYGKEGSKHTFGVSAFGISGFGVTFPQSNSNPINMPQPNGFGHIESDYMLLQIGFAWAYELTNELSIGVQPTINYAALELAPNPTANPNSSGYPVSDKASAIGYGAQFGVFYNSPSGFKLGASYKTPQKFDDLKFKNTYLNNSTSENAFNMDYPSILSFGLGYSTGDIDLAVDYRFVDYENTNGFAEKGWTPTYSVAGFGWKNINILSVGLQYKGIEKLPLRVGYTYSSNPIDSDLAFFSIPATAVIKNAFQFGTSYPVTDNFKLNGVFHYGTSGGETSGPILNPAFIPAYPPYGSIPGSEVSYKMTTSMVMLGLTYTFSK
jgi:long-chain fatty acid transport protein